MKFVVYKDQASEARSYIQWVEIIQENNGSLETKVYYVEERGQACTFNTSELIQFKKLMDVINPNLDLSVKMIG